jgi:hypothetical protein
MQQGLILEQIQLIRKLQPRCGGRKLFIELSSFFKQHHIKIGRDAFFDLLRRNKLLVRKLKRNVYTTMSKHHFRRYPNLANDFTPLKLMNYGWLTSPIFPPNTAMPICSSLPMLIAGRSLAFTSAMI